MVVLTLHAQAAMLGTAGEDGGNIKVLHVTGDDPQGWLRTLEVVYPCAACSGFGEASLTWVSVSQQHVHGLDANSGGSSACLWHAVVLWLWYT